MERFSRSNFPKNTSSIIIIISLSYLVLVLTTTPFLDLDDLVQLLLIKEDVVDADAARVRAFNAATFIIIILLL